ncbi:hypothetical protein P3X46_032055 [Hevea brasiliensis]|uniref:Anaphase-promoting complex subunit 4 WD40 domain-containing protein n=1 Tax=Hevea brasiliensis TaxID=3981 RepID=A0ABQ9KP21_HEVBR|nr:hypothetical protein P3X46_032055 [Hevea brasiliensis]
MLHPSETHACVPTTERGRGILICGNPKSNSILFTNNRSVLILNLDNPLDVSVYGDRAYQATKEFKVLSGRIDDLQWSPDALRIVACGDGKGKSLLRAFMWDSGTNVGEFDGHSRRAI